MEKDTRREGGSAGISAPSIPVGYVVARLGGVVVAVALAIYLWWRVKRWRWERRYRAVAGRLARLAAAPQEEAEAREGSA